MLGLHFIKNGKLPRENGKFFSDIYDMRQVSDYDDFIDYGNEDVEDLINPAKELIQNIKLLIKD